MNAEEIEQEGISVIHSHEQIPGTANEQEQHRTGKQMHMSQFLQIPFPCQEDQRRQSRQHQADGAFGQHSQRGQDVTEPVISLIFRIAEIEKGDGPIHKQEQRGIGNYGFRQNPELQGCAQNQRRNKSHFAPIHTGGKPEDKPYIENPGYRRRKAGSPFIYTKQAERQSQFPVVENRFVIPVVPVNLWRQPVPGLYHFLCRKGIIGFCGISYCQQLIGCQKQQSKQHPQHKIRMFLHIVFHLVPPSVIFLIVEERDELFFSPY